jgi:hypothetical protein
VEESLLEGASSPASSAGGQIRSPGIPSQPRTKDISKGRSEVHNNQANRNTLARLPGSSRTSMLLDSTGFLQASPSNSSKASDR